MLSTSRKKGDVNLLASFLVDVTHDVIQRFKICSILSSRSSDKFTFLH